MDNTEAFARDRIFHKYIDSCIGQIDKKLSNNPKFLELFMKELNFLYRKTQNTTYSVQVNPEGTSVSITSYNPLVDCGIAFRNRNRGFFRTTISLVGDNMKLEYCQGVLFDRKTLDEKGMRVNFQYGSKMETEYTCNYYDSNGIEYSNSSYKDINYFDDSSKDIDLREKVMSSLYKPVFSEYQLAVKPVHIVRANIRNTYRRNESLAIIHSNVCFADRKGYHDLVCSLYTSHPLFPEMLRGAALIAKTSGEDNNLKFDIVSNYADNFDDLYQKAYNEFKEGLATSPLALKNSTMFDALVKRLG